MDQLLIVLIDPGMRKIFIYGEYNREFLLEEMHMVKALLKDRTVMYIRDATEMTADEVIENAELVSLQLPERTAPKRFFRVNVDGFTTIPEYKIRFGGPRDCREIEQFGNNVFERSPTMAKLLISGKLEILSEEEVAKIKKPRPSNTAKDKQLESLILKTKVENFEPDTIFTEENEIPDDDIVTDEEDAIKRFFGPKE
jgi:hypothetical protein